MGERMTDYTLWLGDCLEEMDRIESGSVDAIICDLPYGTTACSWDVVIPFEPLWKQYKRVIKKRGAVVLFGSEPFSSLLRTSNLEWFKYDWVWDKVRPQNFFNAKLQPLKNIEEIVVFYNSQPTYNPQGTKRIDKIVRNSASKRGLTKNGQAGHNGGRVDEFYCQEFTNYPTQLLRIKAENFTIHPTQKPVALLSYLILTYTNEGETVLDSTCGSGSTLEAAMRTGRHSIGIEKDLGYFQVASDRLARVAAELRGELNHLPMFAEAMAV